MKTNPIKRVTAALAVVLAIFIGSVALSAPVATASSQLSCYGESCDGKDPAASICAADARTIQSGSAKTESGKDYGLLELRYSPKCHSNWVRFTPWHGVRSLLGNLAAKAEVDGSPWIWREGVAHSLRGKVGSSSLVNVGITSWTAMVTADGKTCSSVGVYETEFSERGGSDRRSLGTYNAPCIS